LALLERGDLFVNGRQDKGRFCFSFFLGQNFDYLFLFRGYP